MALSKLDDYGQRMAALPEDVFRLMVTDTWTPIPPIDLPRSGPNNNLVAPTWTGDGLIALDHPMVGGYEVLRWSPP